MKRLIALRGAVCCRNDTDDIVAQVAALYDELLVQNQLCEPEIISLIFSVTRDLDAVNPAAALRHSGRATNLALFAVQEAETRDRLKRTIRVLMHCYIDNNLTPCHVYQNGAEILRPDRSKNT